MSRHVAQSSLSRLDRKAFPDSIVILLVQLRLCQLATALFLWPVGMGCLDVLEIHHAVVHRTILASCPLKQGADAAPLHLLLVLSRDVARHGLSTSNGI
jgi:hypothetical protein